MRKNKNQGEGQRWDQKMVYAHGSFINLRRRSDTGDRPPHQQVLRGKIKAHRDTFSVRSVRRSARLSSQLGHEVLARPRQQEIPQVGHRAYFHLAFRILRARPDVRQQHVLREREQPGIHPRFVWVHVQTDRRQLPQRQPWCSQHDEKGGTHVSILECPNHRLLVYHPTPCRIHKHAAALHHSHLSLPDHPPRVLTQRHMHSQHVRLSAQRLEALHIDTPFRDVGPAVPIVVEHAHRKGVGEVGEVQADPAESEDAEGAGGEVVRRPGRNRGLPGASPQRAFGVGKVAEGGEDEVEGGRGGGFIDCASGVGDADAWRGGR
jgi:hypothetical protein